MFKKNQITFNKKPIEYFLVLNCETKINSSYLKIRLYDEGLKERKCEICKLTEWQGKLLRFDLDHIDGNNKNNQIDNLRILCPNCHSQTPTHSKRKKSYKKHYKCVKCNQSRTRHSKSGLCLKCSIIENGKNTQFNSTQFKRKVLNRPTCDILMKEINDFGYCAVGRKYGVSDNSVRKWAKKCSCGEIGETPRT